MANIKGTTVSGGNTTTSSGGLVGTNFFNNVGKTNTSSSITPTTLSNYYANKGNSTLSKVYSTDTNTHNAGMNELLSKYSTPTTTYNYGGYGTSESGGGGADYLEALVSLLNKQMEAQENARKAQLEATKKANQEAYDQSYRDRYSAYKKNEKLIGNQTKNNLSGNMLTQRLGNQLSYYNGVNSDMNTLNTANANGEIANYQDQANNLGTYYSNLQNLIGNASSVLDADSIKRLISKISY